QGLVALGGRLTNLLRPRGWGVEHAMEPDAARAGEMDVDPALIDRYLRYENVQEVRGTDLVDVSFTTPSAALSAFLAAAHTQAYMDACEEARRATDVSAKEFLADQLVATRQQVTKAE